MGINKYMLYYMLNDHMNRNRKPQGKLLTLSRYFVKSCRQEFNHICSLSHFNIQIEDNGDPDGLLYDDQVFLALGFDNIESMDISNFEGADIIHDLNYDVSRELHDRYDCIIDGGTIEHVFNTSKVLENIYKMLKTDGVFMFDQPAFEEISHGLYNFSPELFIEYFKVNKYQINALFLYKYKQNEEDKFQELKNISDANFKDVSVEEGYHYKLWGSVTKTSESTFMNIPYQGGYYSLWETNNNRVYKILNLLKTSNSVYIYGEGEELISFLRFLPSIYRNKVKGILKHDKAKGKIGYFGYQFYDQDEICKNDSVIVLNNMVRHDLVSKKIYKLICKRALNTIVF